MLSVAEKMSKISEFTFKIIGIIMKNSTKNCSLLHNKVNSI